MELKTLRGLVGERARHKQTMDGILAGAVERPPVEAETVKKPPTLDERLTSLFDGVSGPNIYLDYDDPSERWTRQVTVGIFSGKKVTMRFAWTETDTSAAPDELRAEFFEMHPDSEPEHWAYDGGPGEMVALESVRRDEFPEGSLSRTAGATRQGYLTPEERMARLEQSLQIYQDARDLGTFAEQPLSPAA